MTGALFVASEFPSQRKDGMTVIGTYPAND